MRLLLFNLFLDNHEVIIFPVIILFRNLQAFEQVVHPIGGGYRLIVVLGSCAKDHDARSEQKAGDKGKDRT